VAIVTFTADMWLSPACNVFRMRVRVMAEPKRLATAS
jgi:hypothetical protein